MNYSDVNSSLLFSSIVIGLCICGLLVTGCTTSSKLETSDASDETQESISIIQDQGDLSLAMRYCFSNMAYDRQKFIDDKSTCVAKFGESTSLKETFAACAQEHTAICETQQYILTLRRANDLCASDVVDNLTNGALDGCVVEYLRNINQGENDGE